MDKLLKQRLIGASILIALAVIFVPMLFDNPEDQTLERELSIELPSPPGDRPAIRRLPLDPDQARATAPETRVDQDRSPASRPPLARPDRIEQRTAERTAPSGQVDETAPDPGADTSTGSSAERERSERLAEADPAAVDTGQADGSSADPDRGELPVTTSAAESNQAQSDPAAASPAPESSASDEAGFMVQVASFSSRENADELATRLTALGHVAQIDRIVRGPSDLHRVRTGPYPERRSAERALGQIRQTVSGVQPVIVGSPSLTELNGGDSSAASGFVVQVGSFASRNNALRLNEQLSQRGLDAFVHQDQAGSRTIWRVRVGPIGSREQAQARLAELIDGENLDGLVVSHP